MSFTRTSHHLKITHLQRYYHSIAKKERKKSFQQPTKLRATSSVKTCPRLLSLRSPLPSPFLRALPKAEENVNKTLNIPVRWHSESYRPVCWLADPALSPLVCGSFYGPCDLVTRVITVEKNNNKLIVNLECAAVQLIAVSTTAVLIRRGLSRLHWRLISNLYVQIQFDSRVVRRRHGDKAIIAKLISWYQFWNWSSREKRLV